MFVKERMTSNPVTVTEDTSLHDALRLLRERKVRRLPVLNKAGDLVGIISEKDLLYAAPSPATSLSVFEVNYLIAQIKIKQLMSEKLITVDDDCPLEEAARIMADNAVSGLPVLHNGKLVGMITESDLFKSFLELLGARSRGLRLTVLVPNRKGVLAQLTGAISRLGGDIIALGTVITGDEKQGELILKVRDVDRESLLMDLNALEFQVVDLREV